MGEDNVDQIQKSAYQRACDRDLLRPGNTIVALGARWFVLGSSPARLPSHTATIACSCSGAPTISAANFLISQWMPRFWLEASDGSTLMQIQKNALLFNWRKKETDYPHFDFVKAAFEKNKKRFFKFLSDELSEAEPKAQLAELNYVNSIERCFKDDRISQADPSPLLLRAIAYLYFRFKDDAIS
jgi:hypothetical protein